MEEAREALAAAGIESRARRLWGGGSWAHRLLNCYTAHELAAVRSRKTCACLCPLCAHCARCTVRSCIR